MKKRARFHHEPVRERHGERALLGPLAHDRSELEGLVAEVDALRRPRGRRVRRRKRQRRRAEAEAPLHLGGRGGHRRARVVERDADRLDPQVLARQRVGSRGDLESEGDVVSLRPGRSVEVVPAAEGVVGGGGEGGVGQGAGGRGGAVGPQGGLALRHAVLGLPGASAVHHGVLAPGLPAEGISEVDSAGADVKLHRGGHHRRVPQPEGELLGRRQRHRSVRRRLLDPGDENVVDPELHEVRVERDQVVRRFVHIRNERRVNSGDDLARRASVGEDRQERAVLVAEERAVRWIGRAGGPVQEAELSGDAGLEPGGHVLHVHLAVQRHRHLLREEGVRVDVRVVAGGRRVARVQPEETSGLGNGHGRGVLLPHVRLDDVSSEHLVELGRIETNALPEVSRRVVRPNGARDPSAHIPRVDLAAREGEACLLVVGGRVDENVAVGVYFGDDSAEPDDGRGHGKNPVAMML